MNSRTIQLADVKASPYRFSEDRGAAHQATRQYTPILENIIHSLQTYGQLNPIHVRLNGLGGYELIDGHIVVDAARQLGLTSLDAIVHSVSPNEARLMYIHFNLNRCGQYGHYHVKIHRVFGAVDGDSPEAKAKVVSNYVNWPTSRVLDYIELDERGKNWAQFTFVPKQDGTEQQPDIFADVEHTATVPDCQ